MRMSFKIKGKMWIGRVRNQIFLAIIIQVIRMEMMRRNNKYFVINIIESKLSKRDMQERYQNEGKKAHRQKVEVDV